ncbi:hypothetical protein ABZX75_25905 [Streptomyces sp. NPDC003038]
MAVHPDAQQPHLTSGARNLASTFWAAIEPVVLGIPTTRPPE